MSRLVKGFNEEAFIKLCAEVLKNDRWIFIGVSGGMGSGKSCFATQFAEKLAGHLKTPFSYDGNITYLRSELLEWIDGKGEQKTGQKPEYSVIVVDELISIMFNKNWYDREQIAMIELFNKIRDRHLCVIGCIPNFFELDKGAREMIEFRVHIYRRYEEFSIAYVWTRDDNPHSTDPWLRKENAKSWNKKRHPYGEPNFVGELCLKDWPKDKKDVYMKIRNTKRVGTEAQNERKDKKKN